MIVAFASNQVMYGKGDGVGSGTVETITTDPVPMNGMNQASGILNVHSIVDPGSLTPALVATCQVSNDGVNWVDDGPVTGNVTTTGPTKLDEKTTDGQFVRFKFEFTAHSSGSSDEYVFITFDLHVRLDHS